MKLYFVPPRRGVLGIYSLITEEGELLGSDFFEEKEFAFDCLVRKREKLLETLDKRFGKWTVLRIGEDAVTREEILRRNKAYWKRTFGNGESENHAEKDI